MSGKRDAIRHSAGKNGHFRSRFTTCALSGVIHPGNLEYPLKMRINLRIIPDLQ